MEFEWDEAKAESNERKHDVAFSMAVRVFSDAAYLDLWDDSEEYGEDRWIALGLVDEKVLAVVYTFRGENIRLISARKAEKHERDDYWKNR